MPDSTHPPEILGMPSEPTPGAPGRVYEVWRDVRAWVYHIQVDAGGRPATSLRSFYVVVFTGRGRVGNVQRCESWDAVAEQLRMMREMLDPDSDIHEPARGPGGEIALIQPLHRLD